MSAGGSDHAIARFREGTTFAPRCREVSVELRNGFIIGIFNYCDRWCEACPFTSRCRLFADMKEIEASLDPGLRALVEAPPLEPAPPPPSWLAELLEAMDKAIDEPADTGEPLERALPPEHRSIEARAHDYQARLKPWLQTYEFTAKRSPTAPQAVVLTFHILIAVKIHRALQGLADDRPEDRDWPPDYDGSAKVALLAIERSRTAWLELVNQGAVSDADAALLVADLVWLGDALERVFPNARAFVRPAFDEPDEVSRLLARERR